MRILIIISQYLPAQTPNTLRWQPLAEYFSRLGHEVHILTTKRTGYQTPDKLPYHIHRAGHNSLKDALYNLFNRENRRNEVHNTPRSPGTFSRFFDFVADRIWRKYYWPDGSTLFIKPGIRLGKTIVRRQQISHIISVGLPFSCHQIARALIEDNPEVHWLMDVQDPFSISKEFRVNNFKKYEAKNYAAERAALSAANAVTMTNQKAAERYRNAFPESAKKIAVIPPLLNPPDILPHVPKVLNKEKTHFCYSGSFYTGVRSITPLLLLLDYALRTNPSFAETIRIHLVGQLDRHTIETMNAFRHLDKYIINHGFVPRNQAYDYIAKADFLLNFGNTTDYHLPSKVVDFLYLQKPVINLITRVDDTSKLFWQNQLPVLNLLVTEESLAPSFQALREFISQPYYAQPDQTILKRYGVTAIGDMYLSLLTESA